MIPFPHGNLVRIEFSLLVVFSLASPCAAAELDWDKPPWIEENAIEFWYHSLHSPSCGTSIPHEISLNYNTTSGGSSYQMDTRNDCYFTNYNIRWFRSDLSWPQPYDDLHPGTLVRSQSDGLNGSTGEAGAPSYIREYCDVYDEQFPIGDPDYDFWYRIANTTLTLHTGGKAADSRRRLYSFYAWAERVNNPRWRHIGGQGDPNLTIIGPGLTTIGGLALGYDWYVYMVLDDNSTRDISMTTPYSFFKCNLYYDKHLLNIYGNASQLDRYSAAHVIIVGQRVGFHWQWSPPVPGLASETPNWSLTATPVNRPRIFNAHDGTALGAVYYFDPQLLSGQTPFVWFVRGGENEYVSLGLSLDFANGQHAAVADKGYFNVHVPQITVTCAAPGARQLSGEIRLDTQVFLPSANIKSLVNGTVRWTQNIKSDMTTDVLPFRWNTHGEFYSGNGDPYIEEEIGADSNGWPTSMEDSPGMGYFATIALDFQYKTYIRFRPTNPESIFITLRRIDWSWTASVVDGRFSTFSPTPVYSEDATFPEWTDVLYNGLTYW